MSPPHDNYDDAPMPEGDGAPPPDGEPDPVHPDEQPAKKRAPRKRKPAAPIDPDDTSNHPTDLGNAQRLVQMYGDVIRYCHAWKCWLVYDGKRWKRDATAWVIRAAKDIPQIVLTEAAHAEYKDLRETLAEWALKSEGATRIRAAVELAQSEQGVPVTPEQLDADPWLLNCSTGTIDLRTGRQRDHSAFDLITKLAPVDYDPTKIDDDWSRFVLESCRGDAELAKFLQRAAGYALTGDTREEKLFFVHGPPASGKSTFLEAIKATLGDYATTADFEAFLSQNNGGGPRNDIARLFGARFVVSIEVDEGKRLAEGLVKTLTGGDTVTARFLYCEAFEFKPQFKLFLAANHAPRVKDDDAAMWRRILRVPFDNAVPKEKRNPRLKAAFTNPHVGGPAILAWLVEGCRLWQEHGLGVPAVVEEATEQYRADMDPLKDFFEECCEFGPDARVTRKALWERYERWVRGAGIRHPLSRKTFGMRVRARLATEFGPSFKADGKVWIKGRLNADDGWNGVHTDTYENEQTEMPS